MRESFNERWSRKELECGFGVIASKMVDCGSDMLPDDAAPCLTFELAAQPVQIWKMFGSQSDWSPEDRERLAPYFMIGSDGAGNPICIENTTGIRSPAGLADDFVGPGIGRSQFRSPTELADATLLRYQQFYEDGYALT
ncbi:MAG TPA: hypothetical protein VGJ05_22245, partial [Fimbriiglobus sp.]